MATIRAKVDTELTNRVGKWFTVREIQDKLKVKSSTLKPLIMKYAREKLLRRRSIRGTARSVEFSPITTNAKNFSSLLKNKMPYRNLGGSKTTRLSAAKKSSTRTTAKKSKTSKKSSKTSSRSRR
jgi:hypothetical protein